MSQDEDDGHATDDVSTSGFLLFLACAVLLFSWRQNLSMSAGPPGPAEFGPVGQWLLLFCATGATVLTGICLVFSSVIGLKDSILSVVIAALCLVFNLFQLGFTLFGPRI